MNKILFVCQLLLGFSLSQDEEIVEDKDTEIIYTGSGPIRGKERAINGKTHYEFLGIPYAQPPVGKLRFKPPMPVSPWTSVLDAFSDGPGCMQKASYETPGQTNFSEDCLTLNIFTNSIGMFRKQPQAVMLWIHGGGFTLGSKDLYRMDNVVDEDVVLVAINYRLHALGFLSFGNNLVSGNMGLRDQHLAIQWVRYNIHHFGGDPNRITIFGESAGGISVHAQVLSPANNGLLAGAISQSGSSLYLNLEKRGIEVEYAKNALVEMGCPTTMDQRSLDCLQAISAEDAATKIIDADEVLYDATQPIKFWYWPVIDTYADVPFIPMDPLEAMKTGMFNRIPFMSGTVAIEGLIQTGVGALTGVRGSAITQTMLIPPRSGFYINYGKGETFNKVATMFYNHTTGDSLFEQEKPAIDFFTDVMFLSADQKTVELMSEHMTNVFNYHLTQQTNNSLLAKDFGYTELEATPTHADDLVFIVTSEEFTDPASFSEEETSTAMHMVKYWTTFAKYGTPSHKDEKSPVWVPFNSKDKSYLDLKSSPEMKRNVQKERMFFWDKMVWEERERLVEKNQLYLRTTQFLLNGYSYNINNNLVTGY